MLFVLVLTGVGAGVAMRHRQPCGAASGDGTAGAVRGSCPRCGGDWTHLGLVRRGGKAGLEESL